MRDSMVLYRSFAEAMDELPAEEYKETMQAITRYAMDGVEPDCSGVVKAIFLMAKPQIDANNKRYENGKRGGKPKQTKAEPNNNQSVTKPKPKQTKAEPNVNVNVNDNVSKEKEILKKKKEEFESLWKEYPRKNGKKDAERHYIAATKEGVKYEDVLEGIRAYKKYIELTGTLPQYIKMGSAFFCQRAWSDDWTVHKPRSEPKSRTGQYQPEPPKYKQFEPEPEIDAVEMPDEIREKLKGMFT